MTWIVKPNGDLVDPHGTTVANIGDPPYQIPDDVQAWAETEVRAMSMSDLTTDQLVDFAQIWSGDVRFERDQT